MWQKVEWTLPSSLAYIVSRQFHQTARGRKADLVVGVEEDTTMRDDSGSAGNGNESTYQSVAALAADIGLSERSTRSALRRGEIPHIRIGRRFILPRTAIADWLRSAGRSQETEQGGDVTRLR